MRAAGGSAVVAALLLSGCAPWSFSLDDCGATCGDGPFFMLDRLEFVLEDETGLGGFDLDGNTNDCGVSDGRSPDGVQGIDNQFGTVWDSLPDTVATVIPEAIDTSLRSGAMSVVLEWVGPDPDADGPAGLVIREGSGDLLVGADARPLQGQTIDLVGDDNVLGSAEFSEVVDGALVADGLSMRLKLEYIDRQVELPVVRGRLVGTDDGAGGLDLDIGGVVPVDDVMALVTSLGGDGDANIRAALEALIPLLIDVRVTEGGACDGLSGAFRGHAVPVYLFED